MDWTKSSKLLSDKRYNIMKVLDYHKPFLNILGGFEILIFLVNKDMYAVFMELVPSSAQRVKIYIFWPVNVSSGEGMRNKRKRSQ